jgi:hypothetical protein
MLQQAPFANTVTNALANGIANGITNALANVLKFIIILLLRIEYEKLWAYHRPMGNKERLCILMGIEWF